MVKAGDSSQSSQATETLQTMLPTSSTGQVFRLSEAHTVMACLRKCSMKRSVEALMKREKDKKIYKIGYPYFSIRYTCLRVIEVRGAPAQEIQN